MISSYGRAPSTLYSHLLRRNTNAELQRDLSTAEQELSTGVHADVYQSLGAGAAEALDLNASIARDEAQVTANKLLSGRIDTMSQSLTAIREALQPALEQAVSSGNLGSGAALRTAAEAALNSLISLGNATYGGRLVFGGTGALQQWSMPRNDTGLSPEGVIADALSAGLATPADLSARMADLDAIFGGTAADPAKQYDNLFYRGQMGGGRASVGIGNDDVLTYGVQANDTAFRDALQGLSMLASVELDAIPDPQVLAGWVDAATSLIEKGSAGFLALETELDSSSTRIDNANERMQDRMALYKGRVSDLVSVDPYEAATRITALETQLQASYAVTARLSSLSFLNFMR
ncbi:flagellin [Sagittula salina]|uniref:Flagellin n=1 Tax=Sagittula salina TaxID=2820268 RepID=A0A940MTX0_9RHOB|nr:flagellin [Sagittula salina]MBP0484583.1 hypothetical protein [Sagittula salina]